MNFSRSAAAAAIGVALLAIGSLYVYFRADDRAPVRPAAAVESLVGSAPHPLAETRATPVVPASAVLIEDGLLSLNLHEQSLGAVLAEISKQSHVRIESSAPLDGRAVSFELRGVPLDRGLGELLKDYDVFFYSSGGDLRAAWIYERNAGAQLVPVPPENWASTADVERQLSSDSAADRISAIETLVGRNAAGAAELVSRALLDEDADVRLRALDVALSAGVSVSRETLISLTYDRSAAVRALALESLASGTPLGGTYEAETDDMLRRMMTDADAEVRSKAAEILESRHTTN